MSELESDAGRDFTPAERKTLRKMMEAERRMQWLWATFRVWTLWLFGLGGAVASAWAIFKGGK